MDADVDATPPDTPSHTAVDPIDELLMPDDGDPLGSCTSEQLAKDTGFCNNGFVSGEDFIVGCVDPEAYLFDCARYDTPGSTRATCQDDGITVGCYVHDVSPVAAFELGDTLDAINLSHKCPESWEGTGYCSGDFLFMCSGGKDYALDCGTFNTGPFTYTCAKDTASGTIQCR
jgi:hypothetical protein